MVGVCLSKGCSGNWHLRLVLDEPGPVQFSFVHPTPPGTIQQFSTPSSTMVSVSRGENAASCIASPGTMVHAFGLLGNAANIMFVVHVMGTTAGKATHFSPPGKLTPAPPPLPPLGRWGSSEEEHLQQTLVNSFNIASFLFIPISSLDI